MTTCELHDRVREDLRDDDRDPGLFPGGRIESKGENFRLLVWVPGRSAVDEFSSESDRPDRPLFTVPAMRKVLLDARMAMGQPRFPLSALEDLVRADAEASVPRFKKAIALLQDAKQSNNELVSAFARHRLEVSPPPQLDEAISTAQLQGGRVRSTLERLKREVNAAPAWVERVKFELDALGD